MGEDHAICAHVLRYALAIVGIFRCGPGTYSYKPIRKGTFVRIDRYLTIPNNILFLTRYRFNNRIVQFRSTR